MNEINEKLVKSKVAVYTTGRYRYEGKISAITNEFLEFFDNKTKRYNILPIKEVSRIEIMEKDMNNGKNE